jgi:hypothetical protein
MKTELEKVAEKLASTTDEFNMFIAGAKWQAEQDKNKFSKEVLKEAFNIGRLYQGREGDTNFEQWFEQFKSELN